MAVENPHRESTIPKFSPGLPTPPEAARAAATTAHPRRRSAAGSSEGFAPAISPARGRLAWSTQIHPAVTVTRKVIIAF